MSIHADPPPSLVKEPKGLTYLTGNQLGKGGFAICYRAEAYEQGLPTGKLVALKIVRTKMDPPKLAQKFVTELQLHSKLHHPNIVDFFRAFSFQENTYVVLELCDNGSLADALRKRKYFTMPEIRRFIIQTCGAVKYLHHRNIIHRDLKTGNLFLDKDMSVKVGDFGLAAMLIGKNDMGARRTTMCGTPNYLAPEILEKGGKGHNEKVDLWAIGIIAYTLAVGKAPFHAPKREDIYKKLQNREYEWPDVSKFPNEISNDLRDLVSSLLVEEDDRPVPDQIVSHSFFKMAFVPETMDSSYTTKKPAWNIRPPTADTIRRGYSESWYRICKSSGVGEYAQGRTFPLTSGKRVVSVVKDVEREIAAGRTPVVPLPADRVYVPYPERPNMLQIHSNHLGGISEEAEPISQIRMTEISGNGHVSRAKRCLGPDDEALKENVEMPKDAAHPPRRSPPPEMTKAPSRGRAEEAKPYGSVEARALTNRVRVVPQSEPGVILTEVERPVRKAAAPRPIPASVPVSTETEKPTLARQPSRRGKPIRVDSVMLNRSSSSERQPDTQVQNIEAVTKQQPRERSARVASQTQRLQEPVEVVKIEDGPPISRTRSQKHRQPASRRIPDAIESSSPEAVLARATQLRDNLASVLQGKKSAVEESSVRNEELPFIAKWVDYSRKLGIGYVLNDGSIGCTLNATSKHRLSHVVVREGLYHLQKTKRDGEHGCGLPMEIYEQGESGIVNVDVDADRRKYCQVVWAKFARYMCQQLGQAERPSEGSTEDRAIGQKQPPATFVTFYERLGSVGIWGFSNGCFQINFPDHTKMVIGPDGKTTSFTCLYMEATAYLKKFGELPYKYIKNRKVLSDSICTLLNGPQPNSSHGDEARDNSAVAEANLFSKKLKFFLGVVDDWVQIGRLGCSEKGAQSIRWQGPHLEDSAGKKQDVVRDGGSERADSRR